MMMKELIDPILHVAPGRAVPLVARRTERSFRSPESLGSDVALPLPTRSPSNGSARTGPTASRVERYSDGEGSALRADVVSAALSSAGIWRRISVCKHSGTGYQTAMSMPCLIYLPYEV